MTEGPHRQSAFARAARVASNTVGHPTAFLAAVLLIVGWAVIGPFFGFSDTWQLVINTTTTIVTFLMVFLIQNTQNRDAIAMHLKLDELIRATHGARNTSLDMEELSEQELTEIRDRYQALAVRARERAEREARAGGADLDAVVGGDEALAAADADADTVEAPRHTADAIQHSTHRQPHRWAVRREGEDVMGLMDTLRGRTSRTARHDASPPVCDHRSLLPRWDRIEDMGRDDLATSYQCEACNQVFSVEEGQRLREEAARTLHETL